MLVHNFLPAQAAVDAQTGTRDNSVGEVCPHCDYKIFPPRDVCPNCGDEAKTLYTFSGKGKAFSYTTIYEAPTGFDSTAPCTVAIVKLDEDPMVTAQLTDLGDQTIEIRMPVEMATRKMRNDGDERRVIVYGYKFRPAVMQGRATIEA